MKKINKNNKLKKYLLGLIFLVAILSFSACSNNSNDKNNNLNLQENKIPAKVINLSNLKEIKLQISGMTCAGCSSGIEAVVGGLDGVESAKVNFETGIGFVKYDPSIVSSKTIINTSNDLYPTKIFTN